MATYLPYTPVSAITLAMFNFDASGVQDFILTGTIRVSVSDGFSFIDWLDTSYSDFAGELYVSGSNEMPWSMDMLANIQEILDIYSRFAALDFQWQGDYDSSPADSTLNPEDVGRLGVADINITWTNRSDIGIAGASGGDSDAFSFHYTGAAGDIFLNQAAGMFAGDYSLAANTRARQTLMHELGHSLGLSHPHEAIVNGVPTIAADFAATRLLGFDQLGFRTDTAADMAREYFTIMSYDDQQSLLPGSATVFNAHTPMILDVIALAQAYGEGSGTSGTGNDTIAAGNAGYRTYFDTGGSDTIDLALYTTGAYLHMGVTIAGADHLVGVAMSLEDGTETIVNGGSPANLRWFYGEYEHADGGAGTDLLIGNALANHVRGLGGNDSITGGDGDDLLEGNDGTDTLIGGNGSDTLVAGTGNDLLDGGAGNDVLDGSAAALRMMGGAGDDLYIVGDVADLITEFNIDQWTLLSADTGGVRANGASHNAAASADARFVAFDSTADNLVPQDTNGRSDVFLKDLQGGTITRVSAPAGDQANGASSDAAVSANGSLVAFTSLAGNLVGGDTNALADIFVRDMAGASLQRISVSATGAQADGASGNASFSADASRVLFESAASNLVAGDSNGVSDIFIKQRSGGTIERVSISSAGGQADGASSNAVFSAGGGVVVFQSAASNLVAGDTNGRVDIFAHTLATGLVVRVSTAASGAQANADCVDASVSADGRYVAFQSAATNLLPFGTDPDATIDVFIKDLLTGTLTRASTNEGGYPTSADALRATLSPDGRYVLMEQTAPAAGLASGDFGNGAVFIKDLQSGQVQPVWRDAGSTEAAAEHKGASFSADGQSVLFASNPANQGEGDVNNAPDLYRVANPFLTTGGGVDTVQNSTYMTLATNVENVVIIGGTATGSGATGNGAANRMTGNAFANTFLGNAGNDTLDGREGNDLLAGGSGDDTVLGGEGDDLLAGDAGTDRMEGGSGNDTLAAGAGTDTLDGGDGTDLLDFAAATGAVLAELWRGVVQADGNGASDTIVNLENLAGGSASDLLSGDYRANRIEGAGGNDRLYGQEGDDTLAGGAGSDTLEGGAGNDTLDYASLATPLVAELWAGSVANDGTGATDVFVSMESLIGGSRNDFLAGNIAPNRLEGRAGNDQLYGYEGDDTLAGGAGNDTLVGGSGSDTLDYGAVAVGLNAELWSGRVPDDGSGGIDFLFSVENLNGGGGDDFLAGDFSANRIDGGAGDDRLYGYEGADTLDGGAGYDLLVGGSGEDTLDYAAASAGLTAELWRGRVLEDGTGASDVFFEVENLAGGSGDDLLSGDFAANRLFGNAGADRLFGQEGSDTLTGGAGNDTLFGGSGNDEFVFNSVLDGAGNVDTLADFAPGADRVVLDRLVFAVLASGALAASRLAINADGLAADADDVIVYNTASGALWFDADGNGAGAAVQFAVISGHPALAAADFSVI